VTTLPPARPPTAANRDGGDRRRAAVVAVAVAGEAGRRGMTLAEDLQIWRLAGMRPPTAGPGDAAGAHGPREDHPDDVDPAAGVGTALEAATDDGRRRAQGLHVTPGWLADDLVARALPGPGEPAGHPGGPTVCDPACGGGAFLLAAARRLHLLGLDRRRIVRDLLWGADIDPVGLAAAEAVLALWAGEGPPPGRLVAADPLVGGAGAWPAPPAAGFDAVVGNPPFQNQLGRATARSHDDRRGLRARYGAAVRAYTDTAWLFLLLGCDLVRPGGRVVLVQPQSVVAARDAAAVRDAVADRADLRDLWLDGGRVFAAAVRVCAPVLERRAAPPPGRPERPTPAGEWGRAWAQAAALPAVDLVTATGGGDTLGARAAVLAGFRDQYYGLAGAVCEREELAEGVPVAPLVTSGALDWAASSWGERPVRYARRRWHAPVVDLDRLMATPPVARRWVARCRAPKLVVGTQTRVVEAAVDAGGTWVPSVPALAVVPHDPGDVWRLAAAVLAPAATAWLAHRSVGTALDRAALKVAKPDLAALPLPADATAWDAATTALRAYASDPGEGLLDRYLAAAQAAYGTAPELTAWWRARAGTAVRHAPPGH
jgi:Eco57I restriction-modification methylase